MYTHFLYRYQLVPVYRPRALLLVNTGLEPEEDVHGVPVRWLHPIDVARAVRELL